MSFLGMLKIVKQCWQLLEQLDLKRFYPLRHQGILFAIQHCASLAGNYAVMQHCMQIKFVSFFSCKSFFFFSGIAMAILRLSMLSMY